LAAAEVANVIVVHGSSAEVEVSPVRYTGTKLDYSRAAVV
jgi:hypothetical protein